MADQYKVHTLKNGLRYLHIPKKSNIISIGFVVKVGSRDEDQSLNGISHFLEHMLFKKTKNRTTNNLLKELDSFGTYYNASTSHEYTSFELHGNNKDFNKLFKILIDMYLNPKFPKKDLEIERGVISEEYNMGMTDIDDLLFENLFYMIFGDNGLGRPIIGTLDNIKSFSRSDLLGYKNIFYNLLNTIFIVIGDINKSTVSDMLSKNIKENGKNNFLNMRQNFVAKQEIPRLKITYTESLGQIYLLFGFRFDGYLQKNKNLLNEKLISHILTSGASSRLWNLLRTKLGVAYYCTSSIYSFEDNSIFTIRSAVDEKRVVESIEKILETLYQVRRGLIKDIEIKRAKRTYCNQNEMTMNNPTDLFDYYSSNVIRNFNIVSPMNICSRINDVKASNLVNTCKNLFRKDNINLVIMGNLKVKQKNKIIDLLDKWYYLK